MQGGVIMIIIEGLDKVGKTTLQQGLLREYDWMFPYRLEKANVIDNDFDDCGSDYWQEFVIKQKAEMLTLVKLHELIGLTGMVIDRFHGTEWSYLGSNKEKNFDHIWEFDSRLRKSKFPSVLICLDAPVNWIWESLDKDERRVITFERLTRFFGRFQEFFERSKLPKIRISVCSHNVQSVLESSKMFLQNTLYTI